MEKRRLLLLGAALVVVFIIILSIYKISYTSPSNQPGVENLKLLPHKQGKIQIFQEPRESSNTDYAADPRLTPECKKLWSYLRQLDLSTLFALDVFKIAIPKPQNCDSIPESMAQFHEAMLKNCYAYQELIETQGPREKLIEAKKGCFATLLVYRALITEWLTQDLSLQSISDPRILADKTIAKWVKDPNNVADVSDRLLEISPGLYPAAKISAMGRFLQLRNELEKKKVISRDNVDRFENSLSRAKELNPNEASFFLELEMGSEIFRHEKLSDVEQKAQKLYRENPNLALGPFFLAWVENKRGNRQGALEYLKEASELEPDNQRYKQAFDNYRNAKPNQGVNVWGSDLKFSPEELLPN